MTAYRLLTLGDLSLRDQEGRELVGASKGLALMAFLAATPGHAARRSHLADLLWPEGPRVRARASLRQAIYYVARCAGDDLLRADGERLLLREDRLAVDLWELERAAADERWGAVDSLRAGPFVPEVPGTVSREFREWVLSVRRRVHRYGDRTAARSTRRPSARAAAASGGEEGTEGERSRPPGVPAPDRHHWVTVAAPAAVAATGVLLAAAAASGVV